jgi:hypothetical protein
MTTPLLDSVFGNQWSMLLIVAVLLLALAETGVRLGWRLHEARDEARRSQVGGVQGAVLGLLGLLLGFTFAMAAGRYEGRRVVLLHEANAVGTAWLRAGLLPAAHRDPVRELLRRYVDARLRYEALGLDLAMATEGIRLSEDLHAALWRRAEAAATEAPTPVTVAFIASLNDVIDIHTERIAGLRHKIPTGVWVLLVVVAGFGCFTGAYGSGARGVRSGLTSFLMPLLVATVVGLIFDLSHPRQGVIRISQQPLLDLQQSMKPNR